MKKALSFLIFLFIVFFSSSQNQTVTLRFTGLRADSTYQQLDSVSIDNLSKSWNEMLYYPDTVLEITIVIDTTGINEYELLRTDLGQNYPNPFNGRTDVNLNLPQSGKVRIEIYDINGKLCASYFNFLEAGGYQFDVSLKTPQTYLFSVRTDCGNKAIKMLNTGNGGSNDIRLKGERPCQLKSILGSTDQHFERGDTMRYVGYAEDDTSNVITQEQFDSEDFTLIFPTIIDTTIIDSVYQIVYSYNDTIFLPDGSPCDTGCFTMLPITITSMPSDAVITSAEDILYVKLLMEHSYIGDLWIGLECPNGQKISLLNKYGSIFSSGCTSQMSSSDFGWASGASPFSYFGLFYEPDGGSGCDPSVNPIGTCWNYAWSNTTTQGYHYACGDAHVYNICNLLTNVTNPHGSATDNYVDSTNMAAMTNLYHPDGSFSNLIGCPINGTWNIKIIDLSYIDNGYISGWEMVINPDILPGFLPTTPTVTTDSVINVTTFSADVISTVHLSFGNGLIESGICYDDSPYPTIYSTIPLGSGFGFGARTNHLSGLHHSETYYVRAYAINGLGITYGNQIAFSTPMAYAPTAILDSISNVTATTAKVYAEITANGNLSLSSRGICWDTIPNPTINSNHLNAATNELGNYFLDLSNLVGNKTYYVRAYASNSYAIGYSNPMTFQTLPLSYPTVTTDSVTHVFWNSAASHGHVYSQGCSPLIEIGFCYATTHNPTIANARVYEGSDTGAFSLMITGLLANTTYYVRAYATNLDGLTAYGTELMLSTGNTSCPGTPTATDHQGNVYNTVQIGTQCWTKENMKCTISPTGISFAGNPTGYPYTPCYRLGNGYYFYNWAAAINYQPGSNNAFNYQPAYPCRGICPEGWHVPSYDDYVTLQGFLDSLDAFPCNNSIPAAKALAAITGWNSSVNECTVGNNPQRNNITGFSIIPRGYYSANDNIYIGKSAYVACATKASNGNYKMFGLSYDSSNVFISEKLQNVEVSVRCVKDNHVIPTVTTSTTVSNITAISATFGGDVVDDGGATITARGFCLGILPNPTMDSSNIVISATAGVGLFTANVTGLLDSTVYYVRAYAINPAGISYGQEVMFTTRLMVPPTVTTTATSHVTATSVRTGGAIEDAGMAVVLSRGICYDTIPNPTIERSMIVPRGSGIGTFIIDLTNLSDTTTYYVRAFAANAQEIGYGNEVMFTTRKIVLPTISSVAADNITGTSAVIGGNISSDGWAVVTSRGFCWDTVPNPTLESNTDRTLVVGSGVGSFNANLTGLSDSTTYYFRAYAINQMGIAYGEELNFVTQKLVLPTLTTKAITNITVSSAKTGGTISDNGWANVAVAGICYDTVPNPTLESNTVMTIVVGSGVGSFNINMTGLSDSTTYYVRAYATNIVGTAYGNELSFTTEKIVPPTVTTISVTNITSSAARVSGSVTNAGLGTVTSRGVCYDTVPTPTIEGGNIFQGGSGLGTFNANLTYLSDNTTYYARAFATNSAGTAYGSEVTFTTDTATLSTLTTKAVVNVTSTTATTGGVISNNGNGIITSRGVCWDTLQNPTFEGGHFIVSGSGNGSFVANVTSLTPNTTYYLRAYATNVAGTAYGNQQIFTTDTATLGTVSTTAVTLITSTSACSGGAISNNGNAPITSRGICFDTVPNPTIDQGIILSVGSGNGSFVANMTNLTPNTIYFVRAYATNVMGTAYAVQQVFTTDTASLSVLTTTTATLVTATSARIGGTIINNGNATISARGICYDTIPNPTVERSSVISFTGNLTSFTANLTNLTDSTRYYVRSYATNVMGTGYGNEQYFTTEKIVVPTITTTTAMNISSSRATIGGNVTSDGWSTVTARGVCYSTTPDPTIENGTVKSAGSGTGTFNVDLTYLTNNTTYYYRAYATNIAGTTYGEQLSFSTIDYVAPTCTTDTIMNITQRSALCCGNVTSSGSGLVTDKGFCYSTLPYPLIGDGYATNISAGNGTALFSQNITNLSENTTYYVRSYATNSDGLTSYGNELSFTTLNLACPGAPTVTDHQGNVYRTVQIGSQCWTRENMRCTTSPTGNAWAFNPTSRTTTPFYAHLDTTVNGCHYDEYFYNWSAAVDIAEQNGTFTGNCRGICPQGWHVPTDAEQTTLINYVMSQSAFVCGTDNSDIGSSLAYTSGWDSETSSCSVGNNQQNNNATSFSLYPVGIYSGDYGYFYDIGRKAEIWSSTQSSGSLSAENLFINYFHSIVWDSSAFKFNAISVRCLKD